MDDKKLTLLSVWYRGERFSFFAEVPIIDGKAKITYQEVQELARLAGVIPGTRFCLGG